MSKNRKISAAEKGEGSTIRSKHKRVGRHNNIMFINLWVFDIFCVVSCNNNTVFVGFSLKCLENFGFTFYPSVITPSHPFFLSLPLLKKLNPPILSNFEKVHSPFKKGDLEYNDMRNFVNFLPTTQKFKVYEVWAKNYRGVTFHDTEHWCKNGIRNWVNFH